MRGILVLSILLASLVAGCLGERPSRELAEAPEQIVGRQPLAEAVRAAAATPHVVLALIDTGINPYHKTFRDPSPEAYLHPGAYLPNYPSDAKPLDITLDAPDYWKAVRSDCVRVWKTIKPGQLYWFPGTKIVGAIYLGSGSATNCDRDAPIVGGILDRGGHGTMVSSRAGSFEYGACRECKIVMVQGFSTASVEWAAKNAEWIDAQSNSWGPFLPLIQPTTTSRAAPNFVGGDSDFVKTVERSGRAHLSFWASGNGALTRAGVLGHVTLLDPRMTPSIVMVGGHDSGYVNLWPDWPPHVVSDSCNSWAAYHTNNTRSADNVGGGTSGASPFAMGGAGRMLLEARRILGDSQTGVRGDAVAQGTAVGVDAGPLADGKLTLAEWKTLLFQTSTARPVRQYEDGSVCDLVGGLVLYGSLPVQWKDVPPDYPEYLHVGYGAVDNQSRALAFQVLGGEKPLPDRSRTDAYFAAEAPIRSQLHQAYSQVP